MANIEIHGPFPPGAGPLERLTAPQFSGQIIDPLKRDFVEAAQRAANSVEGIEQGLLRLGWGVETIAEAVTSLESQLVPRFDSQLRYLSDQLAVLHSIDRTLKSPHRVAAAERISQASELLKYKQYDRALAYALEAIQHDTTNPASFIGGAWALVGSNRIPEAITYFCEAVNVSGTYQPYVDSMRQLARCQLAVGEHFHARKNLDTTITYVRGLVEQDSSPQDLELFKSDLAALEYEASLAAVIGNDDAAAIGHIERAIKIDERFAQLAVGEPLFENHDSVPIHALNVVELIREEERQAEEDKERKEIERQRQHRQEIREALIPEVQATIAKLEGWVRITWPWPETPDGYLGELAKINPQLQAVYKKVQYARQMLEWIKQEEILSDIDIDITSKLEPVKDSIRFAGNYWQYGANFKGARKTKRFIKRRMDKYGWYGAIKEGSLKKQG